MNVETRQGIERRIAQRMIAATLATGFTVSVNDGEETTLRRSTDSSAILRAMFTTDEDYLYIHHDGVTARMGWIHFVYGNDGHDVIADYTTNLEFLMRDVNAYADSQERLYA